MRSIDVSSWQNIIITLVVLALITVIGVAVRVLIMMTVQQRRERANRQINERLRTLIAAYRVLGGSFTGNLLVDPRHLSDLKAPTTPPEDQPVSDGMDLSSEAIGGSDRRRRIRDAVEAALSDILLLGTHELAQLAGRAANDLVSGRLVHTQDLVVELRKFIRDALDLEPISSDLIIPMQGPTRPASASGRSKSEGGGRNGGGGGGGGGVPEMGAPGGGQDTPSPS